MEKITYDLIFGMGQACGCSLSLRRAGLQHLSFPGDWTVRISNDAQIPLEHDFRYRCEALISPPTNFLAAEDLDKQIAVSNTGKQIYLNEKTRYLFNHDFTIGKDLVEELPIVVSRYRKRRNRLIEAIKSSKRVLVVRLDIPEGKNNPATLDDCRYVRKRLEETFTGVRFDVALVYYDKNVPFEKRTFEEVETGLYHIAFNFYDHKHELPNQPDLALTSVALAERFAVKDYRTEQERSQFAAHKAEMRTKKRKLKRVVRLNRLLGLWYSRFNPIADFIARCKQRKFEQIAILGYNCETAFRFFNRWEFLDSSLFAWANSLDIMTLTCALENFEHLGTMGFEFYPRSKMWQCKSSKIFFHGRMKARAGDPEPTAEQLAEDLKDLTERMVYLKAKFLNYLRNDKTTLLAYRLGDDATAPALDSKLDALEKALKKLGARNYKLLVVTTRKTLHLMPAGENRIFRAVNKFSPPDNVTSRREGDRYNWNRIWSEFAPKTILPKKHSFKFEDV